MNVNEWAKGIAKRCKVPSGRKLEIFVDHNVVEFVASEGKLQAVAILRPGQLSDDAAVVAVQRVLDC